MKKRTLQIAAALALGAVVAHGHTGVEIGPNGGRILEFSKNEAMHGEVTVKNGKFHIALLDKDMKPVALKGQTLTATGGDRQKPQKLTVEKEGNHFMVPTVPDGQWVIFQFRESATAKPITARLEYDTKKCEGCSNPEWLCKCAPAKEEKKK